MDIAVKGRRTEVTERFRSVAAEKLAKLERLNGRVVSVEVEVIHEPNRRLADFCERVQLTCRSRGPAIRAEAAADDVYAALDLALAKLEERLRRAADRRRVHHGTRTPVSVSAALGMELDSAAPVLSGADPSAEAPEAAAKSAPSVHGGTPARLVVDGEGPLLVREKSHRSTPMALDQALHEMELVGHDFFLFWDTDFDAPSVVYRRRGYSYGVIRLEK